MEWFRKINSIEEIPKIKFQGYLWASDKKQPEKTEKLSSEYEINGKPANPFIMEANLYSEEENISISVRHVSGQYLITVFYLNNLQRENMIEKTYIGHSKLESDLNFCEIWQKEKDEYCCKMEVMLKKALVFKGFTKSGV